MAKSILLLLICFCQLAQAQEFSRSDVARRLNRSSVYHLGIGCQGEVCDNVSVGPSVSFVYGNRRQVLCLQGMLSYDCYLRTNKLPEISFGQFSVEGGLIENIVRTPVLSMYVSESMLYTVPFSSRYHDAAGVVRDQGLVNVNYSGKLSLGIMFNNWNISLYAKYAFTPIFSQKYIYETVGYDYYKLKSEIERCLRFGVSLLYYINF